MAIEIDDEELIKRAESGDAEAQYDLAQKYRFEDGRDGEDEEGLKLAFEWYVKSAAQGFTAAECALGDCYYYEYGTEKDLVKAEFYLKKAADKGDADAQWSLGDLYSEREDYVNAVKAYTVSADGGNEFALENLIECYREGLGVEKDDIKADELQKRLDDAREKERMLSKMGWEERYEFTEREEFEKSGSIRSIERLAIHYYARKDYAEALKFVHAGIEKGSVNCERLLARSYMYGDGVPEDYRKAKEIFEKLYNNGDAESAKYIGDMFYYAFGGAKKDNAEAKRWYVLAANAGNEDAVRQVEWIDGHDARAKSYSGSFEDVDVSAISDEYFTKTALSERKIILISWIASLLPVLFSLMSKNIIAVGFFSIPFLVMAIVALKTFYKLKKLSDVLKNGEETVLQVHSIRCQNSSTSQYLRKTYYIKLNGYDKYNQNKILRTPVLYDRDTAASLEKAQKVRVKKSGNYVIVVGLPKEK